jgi:glutamate synthase domain-containing protein 2
MNLNGIFLFVPFTLGSEWQDSMTNRKNIQIEPNIASGRSKKTGQVNWEDLIFLPAQLAKRPVDYFKEKINSATIIGKKSKHPIKIDIPIVVAAMSFGALSKNAKLALAKASALAGTVANTGEGGMLPNERKLAKFLIVQYSTARFGVDDEYLKSADAIEIKIGQGAKPAQGGLLPAAKVTPEIAKIRKVKMGQDLHSPAAHPDIKNIQDLKKKITWLRKLTDGKPIILKLGAGHIEEDIKLAVKAKPDIIAIDGLEGGTGAAPEVMLNQVGLPTISALVRARKTLDKLKAPQELWIGGGLKSGADVAKALALGADIVFMGFALMKAMGCVECRQCYKGECPLGIATQKPALVKKLDITKAAQKIAGFLLTETENTKMIAGATGKNDIYKLKRNDLRAMNSFIAQITGVKII